MTDPSDFRGKGLKVREKEGLSIRATAPRFEIGVATITRWLKQIETRPAKTRQRKLDKQALLEGVKRHPEAYP